MTESPQSMPTKAGKNEPYPAIPGPSGQEFQVMSLDLVFDPGLDVAGVQPDSSDEEDAATAPESYKISSGNVEFTAKVRFAGDARWKIGSPRRARPGGPLGVDADRVRR